MSIFQKHKLEPVYRLVKTDLDHVDHTIQSALKTGASLAALPLLTHLLHSPGKRVRPVLTILAYYACLGGATKDETSYQRLLDISSAIELVHTASLIHDDVIDHALVRRDQETVNAKWGNESAVALGVYVYSISLGLIAKSGLISILGDLSETVRQMCEGELFQLADRKVQDLTVARYFSVIERKTAVLFATACYSGASVSGVDVSIAENLSRFGRALGFLFQLTDDYLDFFGKEGDLKKELGQDIEQGQLTLPILLLRDALSGEDLKRLEQIIQTGKKDQLDWVVTQMEAASISTSYESFMQTYVADAQAALSVLRPSVYKDALGDVLDYIVQRIGLRKP